MIDLTKLSKREHQALQGVAYGMEFKEIAEHCLLSRKTVYVYFYRAAMKLGYNTSAELKAALLNGVFKIE